MHYKITLFTLTALLLLSGCSDSVQNTQNKEPLKIIHTAPLTAPKLQSAVKKDYSIGEIYDAMCIICHSADGSGNTEKLTPSMEHLSKEEMITALKEVEADQGHIIMEHNRGKILKMGMEYHAEDMAKYMFKRFNK